jgi:hypothetical protein
VRELLVMAQDLSQSWMDVQVLDCCDPRLDAASKVVSRYLKKHREIRVAGRPAKLTLEDARAFLVDACGRHLNLQQFLLSPRWAQFWTEQGGIGPALNMELRARWAPIAPPVPVVYRPLPI